MPSNPILFAICPMLNKRSESVVVWVSFFQFIASFASNNYVAAAVRRVILKWWWRRPALAIIQYAGNCQIVAIDEGFSKELWELRWKPPTKNVKIFWVEFSSHRKEEGIFFCTQLDFLNLIPKVVWMLQIPSKWSIVLSYHLYTNGKTTFLILENLKT